MTLSVNFGDIELKTFPPEHNHDPDQVPPHKKTIHLNVSADYGDIELQTFPLGDDLSFNNTPNRTVPNYGILQGRTIHPAISSRRQRHHFPARADWSDQLPSHIRTSLLNQTNSPTTLRRSSDQGISSANRYRKVTCKNETTAKMCTIISENL